MKWTFCFLNNSNNNSTSCLGIKFQENTENSIKSLKKSLKHKAEILDWLGRDVIEHKGKSLITKQLKTIIMRYYQHVEKEKRGWLKNL